MQGELIQLSEFLNSTWSHAAVWLALLWAILLFIRKVSKDADNDLNTDKRKALGEELLRIKDRDASSWVPDFISVFDRFFGKKHFSWRCFFRSSLISMITISVLFYLNFQDAIIYLFAEDPIYIFYIVVLMFMLNPLLDYISLFETRLILAAPIPFSVKLILDGILTIVLVIIWLGFIYCVLDFYLFSIIGEIYYSLSITEKFFTMENFFNNIIKVSSEIFTFDWLENGTTESHLVLVTSFTTSIWIWLHGLSRVLIRSLSRVQWIMSKLNVKETPLRAIGTTINLIVLTFGVLLFPVYLLY